MAKFKLSKAVMVLLSKKARSMVQLGPLSGARFRALVAATLNQLVNSLMLRLLVCLRKAGRRAPWYWGLRDPGMRRESAGRICSGAAMGWQLTGFLTRIAPKKDARLVTLVDWEILESADGRKEKSNGSFLSSSLLVGTAAAW